MTGNARSLRPGLALLAIALLGETSPAFAGVKGRPADGYEPLADWSGLSPIIQANAEAMASFQSTFAKVASVSAQTQADRLLFRVRFERPLETYFASIPANTLKTSHGVFVRLQMDTDANDGTGRNFGDAPGIDLDLVIGGTTGTDGTYRVLGSYRAYDETGESTGVNAALRVDRREITYGEDMVELWIPRSALPARSGRSIEIVAHQEVEVGDREAARLRGTWTLSGGAGAKQAKEGRAAAAAVPPAPGSSGRAPRTSPAAVAGVFARLLQADEQNDRATGEAAHKELIAFGAEGLPFCEERVRKGSEIEKAIALDVIFAMGPPAAAAVPTVVAAATDPSEVVRGQAARALSRIDASESSVLKLAALLQDKGPSVRWMAAEGLQYLGTAAAPAIIALAAVTADANDTLAAYACGALGKIRARPEVAVPALIRGLEGPASMSCVGALGAFGRDAQRAVPRLVRILDDAAARSDTWTGHSAAVALGRIGGADAKAALPALERLHAMMTAFNTKQDVADVIYKIKAFRPPGSD